MQDIAVFDGFKCVEHDDSEVFYLFPSENLQLSRTKKSLEKTIKYILASDMTIRQLYALKYTSIAI